MSLFLTVPRRPLPPPLPAATLARVLVPLDGWGGSYLSNATLQVCLDDGESWLDLAKPSGAEETLEVDAVGSKSFVCAANATCAAFRAAGVNVTEKLGELATHLAAASPER